MPPDATIDELTQLLPSLRDNDPQALARIHELTVDLLESIARGMVGSDVAAQDVVQDVFLKLVRHRRRLRATDGRELRAWLVTATRNGCRDELRRRKRRGEDADAEIPDLADHTSDPATAVEAEDLALQAALATLPESQRTALVLRHVGGLSGRELGAAMGRSRGAAYALLARAERSLRSALTDPSNPEAEGRPQFEPGATT